MPIFLASAPVGVGSGQDPLVGLMADSYGVSGTSAAAGVGQLVQAAAVREWTLAVNTPIGTGDGNVTAYIHASQADYGATALTLVRSSSPSAATALALGFELGRTAWASVSDVTLNAVFPSPVPLLTDDVGVHYTAPTLTSQRRARSAIAYTLTTDFASALVGGGRVEAMVSKAASAGVYAVPGTPMTGRITETVEARAQVPWPCRGTVTGMTVVAYSSSVTSGGTSPQFPTRFTLRLNGADTAVTATAQNSAKLTSVSAVTSIGFGDLVSLKVEALSFATGSYFHGWCELHFLPVVATAPGVPTDPDSGFALAPQGGNPVFWQAGRWRIAGMPHGRLGDIMAPTLFAPRIYAVPFFTADSTTVIDALQLVVTAAAATGQAKLGIYAAIGSHDLYPGDLIQAGSATVSIASIGAATVSISATLLTPNQLYYGVAVITSHTGGTNLRAIGADDITMPLGIGSGGAVIGWTGSHGFTLPSRFTVGVPPNVAAANATAPAIGLGVASGTVI